MKTKNLLFILVALLFVTFVGCKKYDDGPTISPWPKKWRVINTWKVKETVASGVTVASTSSDTYQFKGNGDYIITSGSTSTTGTWDFGSKKETLKTTFTTGSFSFTGESKIMRLTSNELWLASDASGNEPITHFESSK
jgi:hypothetical protein